jgi:hypothetical protein
MPRKLPNIRVVVECLTRHEVEFVIVGGVAAALHGVVMMTLDLDLVYARTERNVERLVAALHELGAYYREYPDWRPVPDIKLLSGRGHHLLETCEGSVDVLAFVTGDREFDALLPESDEILLDSGYPVRVVSLEMLIRLKEEMGRDRDQFALPMLRAALAERRKQAQVEEGSEGGE